VLSKVIGQGEFANLGRLRLHVHRRGGGRSLLGPKYAGRSVEDLRLSLGDLVGMDIEPLHQVGKGLLAFHSSKGHFGLEGRRVVPSGSLAHG
jgi:hypothetical protein